jgi:hypothetical protein
MVKRPVSRSYMVSLCPRVRPPALDPAAALGACSKSLARWEFVGVLGWATALVRGRPRFGEVDAETIVYSSPSAISADRILLLEAGLLPFGSRLSCMSTTLCECPRRYGLVSVLDPDAFHSQLAKFGGLGAFELASCDAERFEFQY